MSNIFKPASENELKDRKQQGKIEKFKYWMDDNGIKYIEDDKGNVVDVIDIEKRDRYSWTPLHYASWYDVLEIVKLLISKGADVNAKNYYGFTPLHSTKTKEVANLLISHGAK